MPRRKPIPNILADKTATVSLARNGLVIEIAGVKAVDAAQVSACLLNVARDLVKAGWDELVPDAGGVHGGAYGEYVDDDHAEESKGRLGFVVPTPRA
jgi:hypothetical protein